MEMSDGGGRRRRSPSDDDNVDNPNLRDFLRIKQDGDAGHTSSPGVTLGAVLRPPANRTLLDIIRDDPTSSYHGNRKTWRVFRDKLRLRRAGAAWTSSVPVPASDVPIPSANRMMQRRQSTRFPTATAETESTQDPPEPTQDQSTRPGLVSLPSNRAMMMRRNSSRVPSSAAAPELSTTYNTARSIVQMADQNSEQQQQEENEGGDSEHLSEHSSEEEDGDGEGEPQVRMSLMDLLAETDRQMGIDGSPFIMDDDEDEDDEDADEDDVEGVGEFNCCVCMVRHKGAAFIPCGHTFCRLCSRELWVQRGSCPLCNNFILEILDIF